jgi:hypothetical protein
MLFLSGCTSKYIQPIDLTQADMELSQDEAAIVFFRPTNLGAAIQAPIAEFINDDLKLVSIISAKSKIFYKTVPGKHFFVVGGESSSFLEADFEKGKVYYSYINSYPGFLKARFEFEPVKNGNRPNKDKESEDDPFSVLNQPIKILSSYEKAYFEAKEFKDDLEYCKWYANNPESDRWFIEKKESMLKKYQNALKKHQKTKSENKKIIKPEYGI